MFGFEWIRIMYFIGGSFWAAGEAAFDTMSELGCGPRHCGRSRRTCGVMSRTRRRLRPTHEPGRQDRSRPSNEEQPMTTSTLQTVTSADGTTIAYEKLGSGPAVVLVCGGSVDRGSNAGLAQVLASDFTVYNYDRRGRGD